MELQPERFLTDLNELRKFGAAGRGVVRRAFSDADIAARRWLFDRIGAAGLEARIDVAGNVWGLTAGPSLLAGSHSDTQPEGGWLDGALGVIAALEVARAAREAGGPLVSVVSFQDEEGRFGALTGSEIWTGRISIEDADRLIADDGTTFGQARTGFAENGPEVERDRFTGFLELHIEQGPVLDTEGGKIGVVTGIVGARQLTVCLTGRQNHAGTTLMHLRRDAVAGFVAAHADISRRFEVLAAPETVWTVGRMDVAPNAASVVPGEVVFTVQWRDSSESRLADMEEAAREAIAAVAAARGLGAEIDGGWALAPVAMDPRLVAVCADAADEVAPGAWRKMPSGALHDATNLARVMPAGMLFVPSKGGNSHDFAEDTDEADLVTGLRTLAAAASRPSA